MAGWSTGISQKPKPGGGLNLLQNCDLPPPLKVFPGTADKAVMSSMNKIWTIISQDDHNQDHLSIHTANKSEKDDKLELLKAVRLSQTRAREAERKAAKLIKEREAIFNALLKDSSHLFAYRQLVRLLELQLSKLHRQQLNGEVQGEGEGDGAASVSWVMALAFCLGVAGVGVAFGYRYFFSFADH